MRFEELVTRVGAAAEHPEYAVTWFQPGQYTETDYTIVPVSYGRFVLHRPTGRGGNRIDRDYDNGGEPRVFESEDAVCDYVWERLTHTQPPAGVDDLPPADELARLRHVLLPGGGPEDPGAPIGSAPVPPWPKALKPLAQLGWTCVAAVWGAAVVVLLLSSTTGGSAASPSVFFVIATSVCLGLAIWIGEFVGLVVSRHSQRSTAVLAISASTAAAAGLLALGGGFLSGWSREPFWPWANLGAVVSGVVVAVVVRTLGARSAERRHVDIEGLVGRIERMQPELRGLVARHDDAVQQSTMFGLVPLESGGFEVYRRGDDGGTHRPELAADGTHLVVADEAAVGRYLADAWDKAAAPRPRLTPRDEFVSREDRYSLGTDEVSGRRYASFPVTTGVADYEEYYEVTDDEYARYLTDPAAALAFVEECRRHGHDELLMQKPGWNRGTAV
jgi:hypothetical protein